jgi:anti-anti-sigma factor
MDTILSIHTRHLAGRCVVSPIGDVDASTTPQLIAAIDQALDLSPTEVEINCAELAFIDSTGIRGLMSSKRAAAVRIYLTNLPSHPKRILEITGVLEELVR